LFHLLLQLKQHLLGYLLDGILLSVLYMLLQLLGLLLFGDVLLPDSL
jgi:hypothetical protein